MHPVERYLRQSFIAANQLINVLIFGGYADETLSARAYRQKLKGHKYWGWVAGAINRFFFWEVDHCLTAYLEEVNRLQYPEHYRNRSK